MFSEAEGPTSSMFGQSQLEVSLRHPGEDMILQLALELSRKVWVGDKNRGILCVEAISNFLHRATSSPFLSCQSQCLNLNPLVTVWAHLPHSTMRSRSTVTTSLLTLVTPQLLTQFLRVAGDQTIILTRQLAREDVL